MSVQFFLYRRTINKIIPQNTEDGMGYLEKNDTLEIYRRFKTDTLYTAGDDPVCCILACTIIVCILSQLYGMGFHEP